MHKTKTKFILLATAKGGSGKSTLATNLAVITCLSGQRVGIVDFDPQGSITSWYAKRKKQGSVPDIKVIQGTLKADEARAVVHNFADQHQLDIVFLDTPGADNLTNNELTKMADIVLMPLCPLGFDHLASNQNIGRIMRLRGGRTTWLVFNQCPSFSSPAARKLRKTWLENAKQLNISKRFIPTKSVFRFAAVYAAQRR